MKIIVGREYNIRSLHRAKDDNSYTFRGIPLYKEGEGWMIRVTEFSLNPHTSPGDEIKVYADRFRSMVARTNLEARAALSKEW